MDGHQGIGQGSVTVLVASPPSLVRYGLHSVLQTLRPGWAVSEADSLDMTLDMLDHYTPDLLLLDVSLPGVNSVHALHLIADHMSPPRIVVLADGGHRNEILHWIDGGAQGYLTKAAAGTQVVCAIETVLFGGIFAPASLSARTPLSQAEPAQGRPDSARPDSMRMDGPRLAGHPHEPLPYAPPGAPGSAREIELTERQRAVMELIMQGYNTKMIARHLNIAVATAKVHLAAIYRMVGARNRSEVIVKATRDYAVQRQASSSTESQPVSQPRQITWTIHEGRDTSRKTDTPLKARRQPDDSSRNFVSAGVRSTASTA